MNEWMNEYNLIFFFFVLLFLAYGTDPSEWYPLDDQLKVHLAKLAKNKGEISCDKTSVF